MEQSREKRQQLRCAFKQNSRWNSTRAIRFGQFDRTQRTLRIKNIGKGMGLEGGGFGGEGALESSKVELLRKRLLKAKHFWIGEVAIELSGKINGGINEFEKLFEIFLLRDQRILELFESERSAHLRLMKARLTLGSISSRFIFVMSWVVRIVPPGTIISDPDHYWIWAGKIKPLDRGFIFLTMKYSAIHFSHDTLDTETATTKHHGWKSWL